ncbi:tripartite tricarboxylate transporter substrate-binding protein [Pseudomonadota bacterium]
MNIMKKIQGISVSILPVLSLALLGATMESAHAEWKPSKKVEIVVGCSPGCGPDRFARTIRQVWKEEKLVNVGVFISNKPGSSSGVAYNYLHGRPGDGHYLGVASTGIVANELSGRSKVSVRNFSIISVMIADYPGLAIKADAPIKDAKDFLNKLKSNPGAITVGIGGSRGNPNSQAIGLAALGGASVNAKVLKVVFFESGRKAKTAVLGGHITAAFKYKIWKNACARGCFPQTTWRCSKRRANVERVGV